MSASNYLEEQVLNHVFRTDTFSKPSTIALALLTTGPADTDTGTFTSGTGVEVTNANNYARVSLTQADASWTDPDGVGQVANVSDISFNVTTGSWGTVTSVAIVTSATYDAGEVLFYGNLDTPATFLIGNQPYFSSGNIVITAD